MNEKKQKRNDVNCNEMRTTTNVPNYIMKTHTHTHTQRERKVKEREKEKVKEKRDKYGRET